MQGQDRAGCPQTKSHSGLLDNAGRQGVLQMQEATASLLTMLPCHCGMFRIWVGPGIFVSQYFRNETAVHTWGHEIYGIGSLGSFTTPNISPMYIPNPDARRGVGRRQTLRIRNRMDESEAGKNKKRYNLCGEDGHTYKKCPKMQEDNAGVEVGPSGNPTDGLPPDFGARRV